MTKKKSAFWTFCFSFIPGAGEMYMGFMKMGISLMSAFFLVFLAAVGLNMEVLLTVDAVIWFYSFFHVHNLRSLDDEVFYALEDKFLFHMEDLDLFPNNMVIRYKKIIGAGLVFFGAALLWRNFWESIRQFLPEVLRNFIYSFTYRLPQMILAVVIIWAGIIMIRGKKSQLYEEESAAQESGDEEKGE